MIEEETIEEEMIEEETIEGEMTGTDVMTDGTTHAVEDVGGISINSSSFHKIGFHIHKQRFDSFKMESFNESQEMAEMDL